MANGLHKFSVAEATNLMAQRKVIRVTPTCTTSALGTNGDVIFNSAKQSANTPHVSAPTVLVTRSKKI